MKKHSLCDLELYWPKTLLISESKSEEKESKSRNQNRGSSQNRKV